MKVTLVIEDKRIDLLTQNVEFNEGEQVVVIDNGAKSIYKVESIIKSITIMGDNADLAYQINLR
jgi:hypothetical protein